MRVKPIVLALSAVFLAMACSTSAAADATTEAGDVVAKVGPPKRKDFNTLTGAELASVRRGVAAMMALDRGVVDNARFRPLGWTYQANIHGTPEGAVRQAWDSCEHSSFLFLSWHRMELYFFERILRALSGDNALTLPYWNWDRDAKIPAAFRVRPTVATPNPLFWQYRREEFNRAPGPGVADTALPLPAAVVSSRNAFAQTAFYTNVWSQGIRKSFGGGARTTKRHTPGGDGAGMIERTPHDSVHGAVGLPFRLPDGSLNPDWNKSLGNPAGAAADPLFWPFHANLDRAWACWQQKHPLDAAPTASKAWMDDLVFKFYDVHFKPDGTLDPDGVERFMNGRDVINIATQLGYAYDDACQNFELPKAGEAEPESLAGVFGDVLVQTTEKLTVLAEEPASVTIPLSPEMQTRIVNLMLAGARRGAILLNVGGLASDQTISVTYGIYLDLPQGELPLPESPHYADHMSLFGIGHHHQHFHEHAENVIDDERSFDITETVRDLFFSGRWNGDALTVTFANPTSVDSKRIGGDPAPASARLRFEYVDLFVQ